jgi:hypothetical protein
MAPQFAGDPSALLTINPWRYKMNIVMWHKQRGSNASISV